MKKLLLVLCLFMCCNMVLAQRVYQIRADSVRIYNTCDTAELILENRTKDTLGFLYNKGNGRTEFQRLQMKIVNGNSIAIIGQDTLNVSALQGTSETLQSVTARGRTTTQSIQFTGTGTNTGINTPDGSYLYKNSAGSWALRAGTGTTASWLEIQTNDGVNRGGFYADAEGNIGMAGPNGSSWRFRVDANNNTYANGYYQSSMRILKRDIEPFNASALNILNNTKVRSFIYKADSAATRHIGFIADEIPDEMAAPGKVGVDQGNTVALLVKALQEMSEKVEALQQTVEVLKKQVAASQK